MPVALACALAFFEHQVRAGRFVPEAGGAYATDWQAAVSVSGIARCEHLAEKRGAVQGDRARRLFCAVPDG